MNQETKYICISTFPPKTYVVPHRDVTTGATGATKVASKFSDTLTLSYPMGADSAHHHRGRS